MSVSFLHLFRMIQPLVSWVHLFIHRSNLKILLAVIVFLPSAIAVVSLLIPERDYDGGIAMFILLSNSFMFFWISDALGRGDIRSKAGVIRRTTEPDCFRMQIVFAVIFSLAHSGIALLVFYTIG